MAEQLLGLLPAHSLASMGCQWRGNMKLLTKIVCFQLAVKQYFTFFLCAALSVNTKMLLFYLA